MIIIKFLKILGWPLLIFFVLLYGQLIGGLLAGFYTALANVAAGEMPDPGQIQQQVVSLLIYALIIAGVLSFLLLWVVNLVRNSILGIKETFYHFCGFRRIPALHAVVSLIAGIGAYFVIVGILYHTGLPDLFSEHQMILEPLFEHHFLLTFLVVGVAASLVEEVAFRGIIIQRLQGQFPLAAVLLIQALFFALYHFNILQALYTFPIGILFGLAFLWTGSVWSSIIMHLSYNTTSLCMVQILGRLPGDITVLMIVGAIAVIACVVFFLLNRQPVYHRAMKESGIDQNPGLTSKTE